MKTLKTLLSIFAIAAVFSAGAYAQITPTDDVIVSASVVNNVAIATDNDLTFGDIPATGTATVDPTGVSHSGLLATPTVGELTITGTGSYTVTLTLEEAAINLNDGGANNISFTPSYAGHASTQASAAALSDQDGISLSGGSYKIWVGGSITTSGAEAGTYTSTDGDGDITVSVAYF